jgi:hypothetical protein
LANSFVTVQERFIFARGFNVIYVPAVTVQHDRVLQQCADCTFRRLAGLRSCVNVYTEEGVAVQQNLVIRDLPQHSDTLIFLRGCIYVGVE